MMSTAGSAARGLCVGVTIAKSLRWDPVTPTDEARVLISAGSLLIWTGVGKASDGSALAVLPLRGVDHRTGGSMGAVRARGDRSACGSTRGVDWALLCAERARSPRTPPRCLDGVPRLRIEPIASSTVNMLSEMQAESPAWEDERPR
eukprot:scaffold289626_cov31-Tisochrysis_lutea.AAC.3